MSAKWWLLFLSVFLVLCLSVQYEEYYIYNCVSFWTAKDFCEKSGMEMLMIHNTTEEGKIYNFLSKRQWTFYSHDIWLGMILAPNTNGVYDYSWIDDEPLTWTNWAATGDSDGADSGYYEGCVIFDSYTMEWHTRSCYTVNWFICRSLMERVPTQRPTNPPQALQPMGPYFKRLRKTILIGNVLLETMARSWSECASICLRVEACEVMQRSLSGKCLLYDQPEMMASSNDHSTWVSYQRKRLEK